MMNIGRADVLTASAARRRAKVILGKVAAGEDPLGDREESRQREEREAMLLSELWERYERDVLEGGNPKARKGRSPLRPATVRSYRQAWDLWIGPRLGKRGIVELDTTTIDRGFHQKMASNPTAANRALALLSILFSFAVAQGLAERNPVVGITRYPEVRRNRYLDGDELARLSHTLREMEEEGAEPWQSIEGVRLALLTGVRRGELEGLRWEHIDEKAGLIRIPHAKGRSRELALVPPVKAILDRLPRYAENPYVLAGERHGRPFQGLGKAWRRIRTRAGLEDVRWHDLRHSAASMAVSVGIPLELVQVVLGHKQRATTERYSHVWEEPQRRAAELLAARMAEALGEGQEEEPGDLVDFTRGRR